MPKRAFVLLILLLLPAVPAPSFGEPLAYTDLHPPGWESSVARCVGNGGEVVGYGMTAEGERGFLWASGRVTVLLPPNADSARAVWVNGMGEVAGTAMYGGVPRAFVYRDGRYEDPTPGWATSEATYIGEDGAVAGTGEFGAYRSRSGQAEILPGFSRVTGGNRHGALAGTFEGRARLYRPGKGYLDLTPPGAVSATPGALNDNNLVALTSFGSGGESGYVYSGGFYVVMTPPRWTSSRALGVNQDSEVVGYGDSPEGRRGFFRKGATYETVGFPGWDSTEPVSVNDASQVAGSGTAQDGATHAFLASPASPPASGGTMPDGSLPGGGGCGAVSRGEGAGGPGSGMSSLPLLLLPLAILLRRRILGRGAMNSGRN